MNVNKFSDRITLDSASFFKLENYIIEIDTILIQSYKIRYTQTFQDSKDY